MDHIGIIALILGTPITALLVSCPAPGVLLLRLFLLDLLLC